MSQGHSSALRLWKDKGPELGMSHHYGLHHLPLPMAGALDMSLEDLLTRVDESVDMLHGGSSARVSLQQNGQTQAFIGAIGASAARMEGQVAEAELETAQSVQENCTHIPCPSEAPADQLRPPPVSDRRPRSLLQQKTRDQSAGHCLRFSQVLSELDIL